MGLTSTTPYLSNRTRTNFAVGLLAMVIVASLILLFFSVLQLVVLSGAAEGALSQAEAESNDLRMGLAALLYLSVLIATAVAFSMWIHRAYRNLEALGAPRHQLEYSPGWAVGYYFIPILSLFKPFSVMKEIWRKSDPEVDVREGVITYEASVSPLLGVWWGVWILSLIIGRIADALSDIGKTPESLRFATWALIVALFVEIVAAVLAIMVVRGVNERQEQRSRLVTLVDSSPPPPPLFSPPGGGAQGGAANIPPA
jgi:heme/copper-type cytochrome/quinol oxidase subunit 2